MVRVLNIIGSMQRGGAETFLMNIYRNIDREKVQFDFLLYSDQGINSYIQEIKEMGGIIYTLPPKSKNFIGGLFMIRNLVKKEKYHIVWRHTNTPFKAIDLIMARLGGADHLILHSHNSNVDFTNKILGVLLRPVFIPWITERFACGQEAGKWMYGKRSFRIIANGVDVQKYKYNEEIRNQYRARFGVEGKIVLGHIGRFEKAKNHKFLIKLMKKIVENRDDVILFLIGEGTLKQEIENQTTEMGLDNYIKFLGTRTDIPVILQMLDAVILPSLWEGVPVTLIEAQSAGVPCIVSDCVPHEVKVLDNVEFLSLEESLDTWADQIGAMAGRRIEESSEIMQKAGYDMPHIASELQKEFLQMA